MSRRFTLIAVLSVLLAALPALSDRTMAEDPVPTTAPAAAATQTASRGVAYQETPTLPPPPTTLPPPPPTTIDPTVLPSGSGNGRRAVYSKGRMRVWIVDSNNTVLRTYLVSGRRNQPNYGTYRVFSRSAYTCNIEHNWVCMRWMVRFTVGPEGDNIGFHEIPTDEGVPVQSVWQLGQALSSGCVRQATHDAEYMWNWAYVGTVVVVTP